MKWRHHECSLHLSPPGSISPASFPGVQSLWHDLARGSLSALVPRPFSFHPKSAFQVGPLQPALVDSCAGRTRRSCCSNICGHGARKAASGANHHCAFLLSAELTFLAWKPSAGNQFGVCCFQKEHFHVETFFLPRSSCQLSIDC